jgi:hypothetical protein
MKTIPLTQGCETIVDDADYPYLCQYKWYANSCHGRIYAARKINGKTCCLQNLILRTLPGFVVDHKDRDPLNNTRMNLRIATIGQNNANQSLRKDNKTGYKGILIYKNKWRAYIRFNNKHFYLGTYENKIEAAIAYDTKAIEYFGEFAYLNFPNFIDAGLVRKFIRSIKNRIFKVFFRKRSDGEFRSMLCRTGVKKYLSGGTIRFNPEDRNLFSVFDIQKKEYRFINLESVIAIVAGGKRYAVVNRDTDPKDNPIKTPAQVQMALSGLN